MSDDGKLTEKIREALRASGASQVIAVHEGYGAEWAVQEHEDPMLDALAPLIAAEVRKAQADALRDAADFWQDTATHNTPADIEPDWLRARATTIETED